METTGWWGTAGAPSGVRMATSGCRGQGNCREPKQVFLALGRVSWFVAITTPQWMEQPVWWETEKTLRKLWTWQNMFPHTLILCIFRAALAQTARLCVGCAAFCMTCPTPSEWGSSCPEHVTDWIKCLVKVYLNKLSVQWSMNQTIFSSIFGNFIYSKYSRIKLEPWILII